MDKIYLDHNATTPLAEEVFEVLKYFFAKRLGNPSSLHVFGREAKKYLSTARESIAHFFQVKPQEILFTSGATEGINFLLKGVAKKSPKGTILTSSIEHASLEKTLLSLEEEGWKIRRLNPGLYGAITPQDLEDAIDETTRMIALSSANNETGVKIPLKEIAEIASKHTLPLIIDAVASLGKEPLFFHEGIFGMVFSSHKIHGPRGVGMVILRSSHKVAPLILGGPQESGRRAGSENLEAIMGFSEAISLLKRDLEKGIAHMEFLKNRLEIALVEHCGATINGSGERVCNTSNLSFPGVDGESLLIALDLENIAVSHGSACSSGALEPSRILQNMGTPMSSVRSSIRLSLSRYTTLEEIDQAIPIICRTVHRLS